MSALVEMREAEGVMEQSKEYPIPPEMNLRGLFLALRKLTESFDSVRFDTEGEPKDQEGNVLADYLGFTAVTNGHETSIAIYRVPPTTLTVDVIPQVNHSCDPCNAMWYNVRDMIYRYIGHWERYLRGERRRPIYPQQRATRAAKEDEEEEEYRRVGMNIAMQILGETNVYRPS